MARRRSTKEKIFLPLEPDMAADIQKMSNEAGTSPQDMVATLIWLGKKALGRRLKIISDEESKELSVSFEKFKKITTLDN